MKQDEFYELAENEKEEVYNLFCKSLNDKKLMKLANSIECVYTFDELMDMENARDYGSFMHHKDAANFYLKNRCIINYLIKNIASDKFACDGIIEFVYKFSYGQMKPKEEDISSAVYSPRCGRKNLDIQIIRECLAYYATERIAYRFQNFLEELA